MEQLSSAVGIHGARAVSTPMPVFSSDTCGLPWVRVGWQAGMRASTVSQSLRLLHVHDWHWTYKDIQELLFQQFYLTVAWLSVSTEEDDLRLPSGASGPARAPWCLVLTPHLSPSLWAGQGHRWPGAGRVRCPA